MAKRRTLGVSLVIAFLIALTIWAPTFSQSWSNQAYVPLVHGNPTPTPAGFSHYSTSYYVNPVLYDPAVLRTLGYNLCVAQRDEAGAQDDLVILDFGQPYGDSSNHPIVLILGTLEEVTMEQVEEGLRQYVLGYYSCTGADISSEVTIGAGVNNYGSWLRTSYNAINSGYDWGAMLLNVYYWMAANGYMQRASVYGAMDLELPWNTYSAMNDWFFGYMDAVDRMIPLLDFGDCNGCNTTPANGWTIDQVWQIKWGNAVVWPVPEIYNIYGANARQWAGLSDYSVANYSMPLLFDALMTQMQACIQAGGCDGVDNTPEEGYDQLIGAINDDPLTSQDRIPWVTDIRWYR